MNRLERISLCLAATLSLGAASKPRIYISDGFPSQLEGEAEMGGTKGALNIIGNSAPDISVMQDFVRHCPQVAVTSDKDKADYFIRFQYEGPNPTTPFVRANKVAVFNRDKELVFAGTARLSPGAVKAACKAIAAGPPGYQYGCGGPRK